MKNILHIIKMTRDNQSKVSKKDSVKRAKKQDEVKQKRKRNESSDSENTSDSENDEMDVHEYRKFISKIFPSKNLNKKIKAGERLKTVLKNEILSSDEEYDDDDEEEIPQPKSKQNAHKRKHNTNTINTNKNKKIIEYDSEEEDDEVWETASEDEEEEKVKKHKKKSVNSKKTANSKKNINKKNDESECEDDEETLGSEDTEEDEDYDDDEVIDVSSKKGSSKLNIIFTIGGTKEDDDEDEDYEDDEDEDESEVDSNEETEDEDVSVSSDSDSEQEEEEEEEVYVSKKKGQTNHSPKNKEKENREKENREKENREKENREKENKETKNKKEETKKQHTTTDINILNKFNELLKENPNDTSLQKCVSLYEKEGKRKTKKMEKKQQKQKQKNMRIFKKIVRDKNTMNDFSFYEKLEIEEQKKIIKELREINKITRVEKPYRMTLLESEIPTTFKGAAMKKINSLRYMEPGSGEFYKIKNWVDTFMRIPFNKFNSLPISIEDGVEKCHDFMENAKNILDSAVYGLNDAKMQIMQMLGQLVTNPKSIGTAIAINGPPGTGKTSLVKEGISKILDRPFAFIALGGATDSSFLEGHSYTYEGSMWGKIVQILIDSKCMNPVIYFDELDKISDTPRGEEITGILTHLTDTSQNSQFHDKYFAEINFDLSKCLFIFSYNDESKVNPILKDRMYRIQTKGYNVKQKTIISNSYLLPKIREQVKFNEGDIIIPEETVHYIIDKFCNKEDGVRNLKRGLEIIHTKLNLYRLMKPGSNLFEEDMSLKVEFPFTITKNIVDKLIKTDTESFTSWQTMFI